MDYVTILVLFFFSGTRGCLKACLTNSEQDRCLWSVNSQCAAVFQRMARLSTKAALCEQQKTPLDGVVNTNRPRFTCSRMEQAEFGEDRSSISDPLDPDDATLIWSAGTFFAPSFAIRKLKDTQSSVWIKRWNYSCHSILDRASPLYGWNLNLITRVCTPPRVIRLI